MKWNCAVIQEIADMEHIIRSLQENPTVMILDSSNKDDEHLNLQENAFLRTKSRYAYLGINPVEQFSWHQYAIKIRNGNGEMLREETCTPEHALAQLERFITCATPYHISVPEHGPQYFLFASYEFGEDLIGVENNKQSLLPMPGLCAWLCSDQLVVDWHQKNIYYYHLSDKELTHSEMQWRFESLFQHPIDQIQLFNTAKSPELKPNFEHSHYCDTLRTIKRYIHNGHIYLINMSQAFRFKLKSGVEELYISMRKRNPAPFGAFIKTPEFSILSTSPERFLHRKGDRLSTEPIKGTRPRGKTPEQDQSNMKELLASIKEQAEHTMVVDLMRNDIGRVCEYGSVTVEDSFYVEKYRSVHQLISRIAGRLRRNVGIGTILRETFPGGSITGTPKRRAMEIIAEMEPQRRASYTGIVGRHAVSGQNFDLSILIRSVMQAGEEAFLSVGGGIVYDSDEEQEYQETLHKGLPILLILSPEIQAMANIAAKTVTKSVVQQRCVP